MGADASGFAREDIGVHQGVVVDRSAEEILQPAREVKTVLGRNVFNTFQKLRRATPADLDAAEQIGLGARHLEEALRFEGRLGAENLGVRPKADFGAAAVVDLAEVFEFALGMAALERHAIEFLAARDFDLEPRGQRVHHGHADAVQAARGLVHLEVEFAAGMQRAHDDFERRLLREFRMRIDGDAAAVIGDGQKSVGAEFHLDEGGMTCQRFVHGVVNDFREQVMQRLLIGAADIHAGPAPHRLQALEHFDVARGVAGFGARGARGDLERGAHPFGSLVPKRSLVALFLASAFNDLAMGLHMLARGFPQANRLL